MQFSIYTILDPVTQKDRDFVHKNVQDQFIWNESLKDDFVHKFSFLLQNFMFCTKPPLFIDSLCKIFTNILSTRLLIWSETKNILNEAHAGFRKNKNIIDHIFTLQSLAQNYLLKEGGRFFC